MADLSARYGVGSPTVRRWLVEAGIAIRPRGSGGFRRQLAPPPRPELAELGRGLSAPEIARRLGVSAATVRRWFAEAGLTPPSGSLKNRPRGALTAVLRPTSERLRQLYVQDGLSIDAVSERLNSTTHLVRTWLLEDNIPIRPGGGRLGAHRPGRVRKPPPPAAELRRLREQERLSRGELAARYRVHPQTVSRWLTAAGLPGHLPPAGPTVSDAQVAAITGRSRSRRRRSPAGWASPPVGFWRRCTARESSWNRVAGPPRSGPLLPAAAERCRRYRPTRPNRRCGTTGTRAGPPG